MSYGDPPMQGCFYGSQIYPPLRTDELRIMARLDQIDAFLQALDAKLDRLLKRAEPIHINGLVDGVVRELHDAEPPAAASRSPAAAPDASG